MSNDINEQCLVEQLEQCLVVSFLQCIMESGVTSVCMPGICVSIVDTDTGSVWICVWHVSCWFLISFLKNCAISNFGPGLRAISYKGWHFVISSLMEMPTHTLYYTADGIYLTCHMAYTCTHPCTVDGIYLTCHMAYTCTIQIVCCPILSHVTWPIHTVQIQHFKHAIYALARSILDVSWFYVPDSAALQEIQATGNSIFGPVFKTQNWCVTRLCSKF